MWKTFQDFLWPHSNLQIKVMWAPLQYIVFPQPQETFPVVSMYLWPLSTAWAPFTFDSLVYRSFSWNFIWQHSAFYKLAECRHIKKNFVVKFIRERHYIRLQQNQTYEGAYTSFYQKWRLLLKHVLWTLENLQHLFWGEQRESLNASSLYLGLSLFLWRNKIKEYICCMPLGKSNSILCFYLMFSVCLDLLFPEVNSNLMSFSLGLILSHVLMFYF